MLSWNRNRSWAFILESLPASATPSRVFVAECGPVSHSLGDGWSISTYFPEGNATQHSFVPLKRAACVRNIASPCQEHRGMINFNCFTVGLTRTTYSIENRPKIGLPEFLIVMVLRFR